MRGKTVVARARGGLAALRTDLFQAPVQPLPPMRGRRALRRLPHVVVLALALVLIVGRQQLVDTYGVSSGSASFLTFASCGCVALALWRPMAAWWLSLGVFLFTAEATFPPPEADSVWPWTVAGLFGQAAVQLLVSLRVPARVAVETLVVSLAATALLEWQALRQDHSSSFGFAVLLFTVVTVVGAALRGRREARRVRSWRRRRPAPRRNAPGAPCWRSAAGSPVSCTTWSRTTCR